jgi:N12 class adenine-specific DNA methylase
MLQLADDDDSRQRHEGAMLNGSYDRFVAKHGCLSTRANALAFRRDPDYPLLLSLEHYDEQTETATKAALFTPAHVARVVEPTVAGEPAEALAASVQWRGRVDPAYMGGCCRRRHKRCWMCWPKRGQVFLDPADGQWKTADEYLSGKVKEKLKQALLSATAFRRNVRPLERVQPEDLPPAPSSRASGAVWIPAVMSRPSSRKSWS